MTIARLPELEELLALFARDRLAFEETCRQLAALQKRTESDHAVWLARLAEQATRFEQLEQQARAQPDSGLAAQLADMRLALERERAAWEQLRAEWEERSRLLHESFGHTRSYAAGLAEGVGKRADTRLRALEAHSREVEAHLAAVQKRCERAQVVAVAALLVATVALAALGAHLLVLASR